MLFMAVFFSSMAMYLANGKVQHIFNIVVCYSARFKLIIMENPCSLTDVYPECKRPVCDICVLCMSSTSFYA